MDKNLIKKIKQKKELSGLSDKIIETELENYSRKNRIHLDNLTKSQTKVVVKEVRSELRQLTGMFRKGSKKREKPTKNRGVELLLKTHSSTAERLDFYPKLKERISSIDPTSILDLGCGLNPIALAKKEVKYYASDINEGDLALIKEYFKENKIKSNVFFSDLRKTDNSYPKADLCLIFKVLDLLGKNKYEISEHLLEKIDCKKIIVSFPTHKLSGKKMNSPKRIWFEKILKRKEFEFLIFSSDNEVFYEISKH